MKWQNKGHEFDVVYNNMASKKHFYLFGAGDYGIQFFNAFQREINIIAYIDNDVLKQNTMVNNLKCLSLQDVERRDDIAIIITMSQYNRIEPIIQLEKRGFVRNEDYFLMEEFIAIYNVYRYDKVYFPTVSFLPSTICNLKCRHCLNFNPFAKKFYSRQWEDLIKDVDLFFQCVDHIMLFHISGGEPMLYANTANLIEYIDQKYGHKIDKLRTVTNGTVVPSDVVLKKLSRCNIEITVDDYREAVPQYRDKFDELIIKLERYGIKYYINKVNAWIDLAPERTDYSEYSELEMTKHRGQCSQSWQELRDGKLYSCNYAAYATVAGIAGEQDSEETYDLTKFTEEKKKELIEFRLGYTTKGYTNFCRKCRGFTEENNASAFPALQVELNEIGRLK